jgi:hypothetical protein
VFTQENALTPPALAPFVHDNGSAAKEKESTWKASAEDGVFFRCKYCSVG